MASGGRGVVSWRCEPVRHCRVPTISEATIAISIVVHSTSLPIVSIASLVTVSVSKVIAIAVIESVTEPGAIAIAAIESVSESAQLGTGPEAAHSELDSTVLSLRVTVKT